MDDLPTVTRLVVALLAALRAGLLFGEAGIAETWCPSWATALSRRERTTIDGAVRGPGRPTVG